MDMNERRKLQNEINAHRMDPFDHNAEALVSEAAEMAFREMIMLNWNASEAQEMLADVYGEAMEQAAYKAMYSS